MKWNNIKTTIFKEIRGIVVAARLLPVVIVVAGAPEIDRVPASFLHFRGAAQIGDNQIRDICVQILRIGLVLVVSGVQGSACPGIGQPVIEVRRIEILRQSDLAKIADAADAPGLLPRLAQVRKKHAGQNRDHGNHD